MRTLGLGILTRVGVGEAGRTDSPALDRRRGIAVQPAVVPFAIVERVLHVLDGAVPVVSAVEGVRARTPRADADAATPAHPGFLGPAITDAGIGEPRPATGGDADGPVSGTVFTTERDPAGERTAYVHTPRTWTDALGTRTCSRSAGLDVLEGPGSLTGGGLAADLAATVPECFFGRTPPAAAVSRAARPAPR
ncbi:hypothetical protein GCM10010405_02870 [Streptomyces macrosporus]|uniref:Uncharacterized protein n=1 Tax=Streptomyces macrosporus TaxID=44032 RepID=A0ABP5WF11_9ACTN